MVSSKHYRSYAPSRPRRRGNPYFESRRTDRIGDSLIKSFLTRLSPRVWFFIILFFAILIVLIWLTLISNILIIRNIEVRDANLVSSGIVEDMAKSQLADKRLFILSQEKLIVFDTNALKRTIFETYALDDIKVTKKLPNTLIITLNEKQPAAVWFEGDIYREIDADGWTLAFTTASVEGLPTIYNNGKPKVNGKKVEANPAVISLAELLNSEFPKRFSNIIIKQLVVDNEENTLKLLPIKGAMIYFAINDSAINQLNRLDILLRSELKDRFENVSYIDLRFKDKIYYK